MRNNFTPTNWNTPAYLYYSDNNTFVENIVFNSVEGGGLYVTDSDNNTFYHNNFFDNGYDPAVSILFSSYNNTWDDGYPSGGNYWLNYIGLDNYLGINQDIPGSDGIGDSPYLIDADDQDNFPLIHPWGSVHNLNTGEIFLTIQAAINDTNTLNGHTILVKKDTYFENVVVNKTINLAGEDRDTTIINGGGSGDAIYISTDWVNVSGFKIINIYTQWDDPGVELNNVTNCTVANCNLNAGILIYSSSSNTIVNNSVSNTRNGIYLRSFSSSNLIMNNTVYSNSYTGIYLFSWCTNNMIRNNSVYLNDEFGMLVTSSCYSNTIAYNSIYDNGGGLEFWGADSITIINNSIYSTGRGVTLSGSSSTTIANNSILYNSVGIILDSSSNNIIENNTCISNNYEGIKLELSSSNTIINNTCSFNGVGISISYSTDNKVYHNNILHNTDQALDTSNHGNQWDNGYPSGGNFWSDYTGVDLYKGPDQNITGSDDIGDTPYIIDSDSQDNYPLMKRIGPNTKPTASFTFTPSSGNISTIFYFDANACSDNEDITLDLRVRWDWDDDGIWDTVWTTTKTAFNQFSSPGTNTVRLEVMDTGGLTDNTTKQVNVINEKPVASFTVNPSLGNITQIFKVNASGCSDLEDPTSFLQVRWDWEDDGIWDTNWTTIKTASHQYLSPGTYTIRLEVMDTGGLTDNITHDVVVTDISDSPGDTKVTRTTIKTEVIFGIAAVATAVLASIGLGTTDVGKYGFLLFFLPLYTRLNKREILDHETRGRIRGMIELDPGIRYNELKKKLRVKNGTLTYHLQVLEREGYIKSKNNGVSKHFFSDNMKLPKNIIRMRGVQKIIFKEILENPGITQRKIAQLIGGSTSTVNYNINIMAKKGIIELRRKGNETECYLIEED